MNSRLYELWADVILEPRTRILIDFPPRSLKLYERFFWRGCGSRRSNRGRLRILRREEGNSFLVTRTRVERSSDQQQHNESYKHASGATTFCFWIGNVQWLGAHCRYLSRLCRTTRRTRKRDARCGHESRVSKRGAVSRLRCINSVGLRTDRRLEIRRALAGLEMLADAHRYHSQIVFSATLVAASFQLAAQLIEVVAGDHQLSQLVVWNVTRDAVSAQ